MMTETSCPKCNSANIYVDGNLWICPECSHEWTSVQLTQEDVEKSDDNSVRDAHGNILTDGDSVIVIKDLKIKGSTSSVKGGTKVKGIRLTENMDGHNISCKIDGFGALNLKSEFVKKA